MKKSTLCILFCIALIVAFGGCKLNIDDAPTPKATPTLDVVPSVEMTPEPTPRADPMPEIVLVALDAPQNDEPPIVNTDTRTPPVIQLMVSEDATYTWLYVVDGTTLTQSRIVSHAWNVLIGNATYYTYETQSVEITDGKLAKLIALADEIEANVGDFVISFLHSPDYAAVLYNGTTYYVGHKDTANHSVKVLIDEVSELLPRIMTYYSFVSSPTQTPPPELNTNKVLPEDGKLKFAFAVNTTEDYYNEYLVEIENGNMSVSLIEMGNMLMMSYNAMIGNAVYDVKWTRVTELTVAEKDTLFKGAEYTISNAFSPKNNGARASMLYRGVTYAFGQDKTVDEFIRTFAEIAGIPYTEMPYEEAQAIWAKKQVEQAG